MPRLAVVGLAVVLFAQIGLRAELVQTPPTSLPAALSRGPCGPVDQKPPDLRIAHNKFRQSLGLLEDGLRSDPQDPALHYQLGLLYESQNHFLKAIGEYREALRLDRRSQETALALASILFHCGQDQEAGEVLQGFLQTRPDSLPVIRLLCRIHLHKGKSDLALTLAQEYVRLDPGDSYGHYLLGLSHNGLGYFEEARDALERSVELEPSFTDAYVKLGLLFSKDSTTFPRAVENLQKAIELGFRQPEVRKDLGFVLLKLGRVREAVQQLELALQDDANFKEPYYLLADAYRKLGMKQEAALALQRFRSLRPAAQQAPNAAEEQQYEAQAYYQEGEDSLFQEQPEKAYSYFLKALEISPDMHLAHYRLAQIHFLRSDVSRAENRIRQAIQLYPLDPEYYFLLAKCLEQRDPVTAIDAIKTAIDLSPAVGDFHNLLANLLFARADYHSAITAYRRATEINPDDPVPHLNLSTALRNMGAVEESEKEKNIYLRLMSARKPE